MGLICYWQRRQLVRRLVLGEPILPGSSLAEHLRCCTACAQARRDFAGLQEILPALSPQPVLSADFAAELQARLQREREARPRPASRALRAQSLFGNRSFALNLAAAAVVLAAMALWVPRTGIDRTDDAKGPSPGEVNRNKMILSYGPDEPSLEAPMVSRNGSAPWNSPALSGNSGLVDHDTYRTDSFDGRKRFRRSMRQVRRFRRRRFGVSPYREYASIRNSGAIRHYPATPPVSGRPLDVNERTVSAVQVSFSMPAWDEMGEVYEALGDHGRASEEYGRAFARQPDVDLAIEASANAESAGELSQALEYCAKALR